MVAKVINVGAEGGDRSGDLWRDSFIKVNDNFAELEGVFIILSNKADVLANGTDVGGVITMNVGSYDISDIIDLGTDRLVLTGGTLFIGTVSSKSVITTNSASPTITFNQGGFVSSGLRGRLSFKINNTGTGAAVRAENFGTITSFSKLVTLIAGTALELDNVTGTDIDDWRMSTSSVGNGIVMTGTGNSGIISRDLSIVGISGKGVDIQGDVTFGATELRDLNCVSTGVGVDVSGSILSLNIDGLVESTAAQAIKISGTVVDSLMTGLTVTSQTDEALDIRGGSFISLLITGVLFNSNGAGKSGIIGDASVSGASPNIVEDFIANSSRVIAGPGGTALTGISKKDLNVTFKGVNGVTDSITLGCFTLDASATTTIAFQGLNGAITAYADAGGGSTTVTSAGHGLGDGEPVAIIGTVAYNGSFTTAATTASTFDIVRAFVSDEATGNFESGWVKIAGSTTDCSTIERFIASGDNEQEYLSSATVAFTYNAIIAGQKSGATVQKYEFGLFFDNGVLGFVKMNGSVPEDLTNRSSTVPLRIPLEGGTGGKFTSFVRNVDASTDFICDLLTVDVALS